MDRLIPVLDTLGLVSITVGAFLVHLALGFVVAGVALIVLGWRLAT